MRSELFAAFCLFALTTCSYADAIPYVGYGSVAPSMNLTATASGNVTGYFYGSAAGGTDYVRLMDLTSGYSSAFLFNNHATAVGQALDFGSVSAGDSLVFELVNSDVETSNGYTDFSHLGPIDPNARTNQYLMSTDAAYSFDGVNHGYETAFSGDTSLGIPAGIYVGMEDLPSRFADFDYNDTQFVFTNVTATAPTPEPGSLILLGSGACGLGLLRRKRWQGKPLPGSSD